MIICPDKYKFPVSNVNQEMMELKGDLDDKIAKITLAKFLRANLGFTTQLVSGIQLAEYQEIVLKGMFNRDFIMCVFGRGCGKTFLASVFCFLYCIFYPNSKILIAGPTFRTARFIFNNLEKIVKQKEAALLAQCFGASIKRADQFEWHINGGSITAIPLNGEKIRGFRANILVLDEFLLLPEDIIKNVLMPFLVAPQDVGYRLKIKSMEDELIAKGLMKEEERTRFKNTAKMIALSSASYTFENLYKTYSEWKKKILDSDITDEDRYDKKKTDEPDEFKDSTYFIAQLSYEAIPKEMLDDTVIKEAQSSNQSHSSFLREFCAQFTDGSDSYFSMKKMNECTVPDGHYPTTKLIGEKDKKYILSIDPSFSNAPNSDFFAMSVFEVDDEMNVPILVHNYAVAGGNLKDHIKYFYYLWTHFNIQFIILDNAGGGQFIQAVNLSEYFKQHQYPFQFIETWDSDAENQDWVQMLKESKKLYNREMKRICISQVFTSSFIRKGNEYLQASIDHKKIWFASKTAALPNSFESIIRMNLPVELMTEGDEEDDMKRKMKISELIDRQDEWIYQTKKQCTLIEVNSTSKGTQSFDLPQKFKRDQSANKIRKDLYTSLMLGNWGVRCYYELMNEPNQKQVSSFRPRFIK
jgi:hypothetical protein